MKQISDCSRASALSRAMTACRVPPSRHRLPCVLLPDSPWSPSTDLQGHCRLACADHHSPHGSFLPKFWQVGPLERGRGDCWVLGTQLRPKFSSCTKRPASYLRTFPWPRTEPLTDLAERCSLVGDQEENRLFTEWILLYKAEAKDRSKLCCLKLH